MAAINCVMLSATGQPVPLPGEKFLYSSTPTVAVSLFARPLGADFSVQPKKGHEYKQGKGTVHVSQKRIVYVTVGGASSTPTIRPTSGASGSRGGGVSSHAAGQASIATDVNDHLPSVAVAPDKVPLATLSVPLRFFVDGHLVQPWFGANYYEALCLEGDGTGDLSGPHIIRLYFKEGGSYEFYTAVEEVKARAELHSRRDTPVEQLPAYTAANGAESSLIIDSVASGTAPALVEGLTPVPSAIPARTAPSPADLAAAETARVAEEAERVQREHAELAAAAAAAAASAAALSAGAIGSPPAMPQEGEAPPGYSV
ncbi:hypothetical protein JCM3774_000404 [Rhodotorula dairenensis]